MTVSAERLIWKPLSFKLELFWKPVGNIYSIKPSCTCLHNLSTSFSQDEKQLSKPFCPFSSVCLYARHRVTQNPTTHEHLFNVCFLDLVAFQKSLPARLHILAGKLQATPFFILHIHGLVSLMTPSDLKFKGRVSKMFLVFFSFQQQQLPETASHPWHIPIVLVPSFEVTLKLPAFLHSRHHFSPSKQLCLDYCRSVPTAFPCAYFCHPLEPQWSLVTQLDKSGPLPACLSFQSWFLLFIASPHSVCICHISLSLAS